MPAGLATALWRLASLAEPLALSRGAWVSALVVGTLPLLLGAALGSPQHQVVAGLALFPLFLGTLRTERFGRGVALVGLAFASHNAVAIALSVSSPEAAALFPDGADYWSKQHAWITTGQDPEYVVANWLPAHAQLFVGVALYSYLSLGFLGFVQGFYEVDLMNFYVGRLIAHSDSLAPALLLGWHPWSALRGLCYVVLLWELASWSLERMTGRPLSTPERRLFRWLGAVGLFVADCVVKVVLLDVVRDSLFHNLAASGG